MPHQRCMTKKLFAAVFALTLLSTGFASAQTLLNTGTPTQFQAPLVISSNPSVAVEFAVTKGETIGQISLYLTPNISSTGFVTLDLFSQNLTSTSNPTALTQFQLQVTGSGWNTGSYDYTIPTTGDYWITLQTQTGTAFDAPEEATQPTGPNPAIEFATKNIREYSVNNSDSFGIQIDEVPEPSTYAMMLGGLALVGFCVRRKLA